MKAERISLENAKSDKLFYFVANAVVYRESDGRCLILKRSEREKVHPNKYCVPGGKLEWADLDMNNPTRMNGDVYDFENALENLLTREVREEAGIEIYGKPEYINSVAFIRPDGTPVIMIKVAFKYKTGEIVLEEGGFTDYKWVNAEEIKAYDCIDGIHQEIGQAIDMFKDCK
jgi:8-oxo-dGTP pyrophosphatase MutT (NUDIX family)